MKSLIIATLLIVGMSAAYAGGLMLLHVGDANGNGGAVGGCGTGVIDASAGCPLPMLGW